MVNRYPFRGRLGIIRSRLIYYGKPFSRARMKKFYRKFIKPGDLCFDIGAHLGNRSRTWLDLGASVIAVEPQPLCFSYLEQRFGKNSRIRILDLGLSDEKRQSVMHISSLTPTVSTFADKDWRTLIDSKSSFDVEWDQQKVVEMSTLDALIEEFGHPTFCKLDVEDHEEKVLRGLSIPIQTISFEYFAYTQDRTLGCVDILAQLGDYRFNVSFGESMKLEWEDWRSVEQMRKWVNEWPDSGRSGDIYATLNFP